MRRNLMKKWFLLIFSVFLVSCTQQNTSDFHLESVQPSEACQNQENNRYWVKLEENLVSVEELNDVMSFEFNDYELENYELNEEAVVLEYNDNRVVFEKLSDSVYTSDAGTWYDFKIEDTVEADAEEANKGTVETPYEIGERARANIRYLDSDLNSYLGRIQMTINNYITGQEAEEYIIADKNQNQSLDENMEWLVLNVTVSLIDGSDLNPYPISLPFRVYYDEGLIIHRLLDSAILEEDIENNTIYPKQTAKGKMAMIVPKLNTSKVKIEIDTGREIIWFQLTQAAQ